MKHQLLIEDRKIIVFATIRGVKEDRILKFILDTGATKSLISESGAQRLGFQLFRLQRGDS